MVSVTFLATGSLDVRYVFKGDRLEMNRLKLTERLFEGASVGNADGYCFL